jgi:predicted aspartyl protease
MPPNFQFEFRYGISQRMSLLVSSGSTGRYARTWALIDTGADISLFDERVATELGLDLAGTRQISIRGLGGTTVQARIADVELFLLEEPDLSVSMPIAFASRRSLWAT